MALRLDRVQLLLWIGGLVVAHAVLAPAYVSLYGTPEVRADVATSMDTPAGLAFSGPAHYLDDYTIGAMLGHQLLSYTTLVVGLMSIATVVRHTRADEEAGRAELVGAHPVGSTAPLVAALALATAANLAVGVLLAVVLPLAGGLDLPGSVLYGAAHTATGLAVAGLTSVAAQITERARVVWGLGVAGLGLAFGLRAVGDASSGVLTWLSPIGWAELTWVYLDNRWWPLALSGALAVGSSLAAVALVSRRDLGAGLLPSRPGRARAAAHLRRPAGLTFRLHRGMLIGFVAGVAFLAVGYGSVLNDIDSFVSDVDVMQQALADIGGDSTAQSFASLALVVVSIVTSTYLVLAALRPRGEERAGHLEALLSGPLSRTSWLAGHALAALAGGALVMLSAGLVLGLTAAAVTGDGGWVGQLGVASLAYLPALWVMAAITLALYGWFPRVASLAWVGPIQAFVVGYLGQLLDLPRWLVELSPFGHVPRVPAQPWSWTAWLATSALAAALVVTALAGFTRRDVPSGA